MSITDESSSAPPDKPLPSEPPNHAELPTDTSMSITNCTSEQSTDVICDEISPSDTDNSFQTNSPPSNSDA